MHSIRVGVGLPRPFTRLRRDPLAVVSVALVALLAATSAGIHQSATTTVQGYVNAHWRGAYDILVRPKGERLNLESTNGLVEPNFVSLTGSGGLSLDQLAAIRSVPGVDLAAPIGFVGYLRGTAPSVVIEIDHLPAKPTLYRLSLSSTTTDGLSRQLVQRETGEILLGPPAPGGNPAANWATDLGDIQANQNPDGSWVVDIVTKRNLPDLAIPVIAVDPEAENALLSGQAPFLVPLIRAGSGGRTAGTFDISSVDPTRLDAAAKLQFIQSNSDPFPSDKNLPVIPLVVSSRQAADLKVDMSVERLGEPLSDYPTEPGLTAAETAVGPTTTSVGSASVDAGSMLAPLRSPFLCVSWPGSAGSCATAAFYQSSSVDTRLVVRPQYTTAAGSGPDDGALSFLITKVGNVGPDDDPTSPDFHLSDSAINGIFPAYRQLQTVPLAASTIPFAPHGSIREPFVIAPVGGFDATAVKVPDDALDYVPLGAYDPADTTYVADPSGRPVTPTAMRYPLLPDGLVSTPPLAITDIAGARVLRGDAPIDAIRIRVSGITDFGPDSQAKIERVASAIGRLGFDVDIVAGSSPQAVDIYVPSYHVDQNPPADLGWVRQHWTTIGAASRITHEFDSSDLALLILSLGAAAIWAFALASLRVERRVRDAAILEAVGWSRGRILRWFSGEALIASFLIALLGCLGFIVGGGSPEALAAALAMSLVWLSAGVIAALDAVRRARPNTLRAMPTRGSALRYMRVRGRISYATRATLGRWPSVAATSIGLAGASASLALGAGLVAGLSSRIGPTLLASATGAAAAAYQPLMLAVLGSGSLAFTVAGLRLDRRRRASETLVLSVSGWSSREISGLMWLGLLPVAALASAIAFAAVFALARPLEIGDPWPVSAAAVGLALSVVIWSAVATRGTAISPGDLA
jgi:hypothetical protein